MPSSAPEPATRRFECTVLPARSRMRRRRDFESALRRGSRAGRRLLVMHLGTGPDDAPLVGFVVSRAVGDAPTRNRVRRRLRHLMRERTGRLPAGARLVVRANPAAAGAGFATLGAELDAALDRVLSRAAARSGGRNGEVLDG